MQKIPVTLDGKKGSEIIIINSDEVVKIESLKDRHFVMHTKDNKYYWAASLEAFEEWLYEEGFRLIDQTNLVNLNQVEEYDLKKGTVYFGSSLNPETKSASAARIHREHIINAMEMLKRMNWELTDTQQSQETDELLKSIVAQAMDVRFARSYAMIQAIYEKKKAERRLEESEQRYKSLFENNPDSICSFDLEGRLLSLNPAMEWMSGYTSEELLHKSIDHLVIPDHMSRWQYHFTMTISGDTQYYEICFLSKSGAHVELSVVNVPIIVNGKIAGAYMIGKDITDNKQAEEMLIKSEKLSIVGQLAAGVAHEIRNPLTSLRGFVQLLESKMSGYKAYFDIMLDELDRINLIVSEFLVIAKPQSVSFQPKPIGPILQNTVALLNSQAIMNNVLISTKITAGLPPILCDENQIKQVFINILNNSIDSMPEGGNIILEVKNYDERHIVIRCIDQGCGIPEERIPRLGEPFYTTKEKGTGLGLMVSFKIIENHQGHMHIESEVNKGTVVNIVFPISREHE
ncbi:ATP-binding protein [Paenibacillus thalictri]|uniref:histidine kinase n=1 Tax=Paenibacillus thalictri TaxID=2527873 RepID=A0A4Q9DEJ9_9BACL|nr:ATP-binding protein [Paenibacillus thalictri]TBL70077.1 PAS domain S-box protein [Paenibacillus thalictri]